MQHSKRKADKPTSQQNAAGPLAMKRLKGWGPEIRALDPRGLASEIYRLYCLDNDLPDPVLCYEVKSLCTDSVTHRFLYSTKAGAYVKQYKSKATYNVFEDYRWFAANYPKELEIIVRGKGAPFLMEGVAPALEAFQQHVPIGKGGQSTKAMRHNCPYSIKKKKDSTGATINTNAQQVCFSAQCIIREEHPGGASGGGGNSSRRNNEVDKHFHYFLHHEDKDVREAAKEAFRPGGPLAAAYVLHFKKACN